MELEKALETYRRELPNLLKQEGQFVVISGEEVLGAWPTYSAALTAGYERYGLGPFMVKKIQATEYPRIICTICVSDAEAKLAPSPCGPSTFLPSIIV